jgi:hypothetical protein
MGLVLGLGLVPEKANILPNIHHHFLCMLSAAYLYNNIVSDFTKGID